MPVPRILNPGFKTPAPQVIDQKALLDKEPVAYVGPRIETTPATSFTAAVPVASNAVLFNDSPVPLATVKAVVAEVKKYAPESPKTPPPKDAQLAVPVAAWQLKPVCVKKVLVGLQTLLLAEERVEPVEDMVKRRLLATSCKTPVATHRLAPVVPEKRILLMVSDADCNVPTPNKPVKEKGVVVEKITPGSVIV